MKHQREKIEVDFAKIFHEVLRWGDTIFVAPTISRTVSYQIHQNNTPSSIPEEDFRKTIAITLLDTIVMEMETRFNDLTKQGAKSLFLVLGNERIKFDEASFQEAIEFYSDDTFLLKQELNANGVG